MGTNLVRRVTAVAFPAAIALLLVSSNPHRRCFPQVRDEEGLEALQGLWVLKTSEWMGERTDLDPADGPTYARGAHSGRQLEERETPVDPQDGRTTLAFKGNAYVWQNHGVVPFGGGCIRRPERVPGIITLDQTRRPPVMIRRYNCWRGGPDIATARFIYSVKGDTLRLAGTLSDDPKALPTTFVTDKDEDVVVLTFRREKS
jgi:hypothetical protein